MLPQAVDAVEGVRVGGGVGPDAVADVVHDARVGDGDADVVGALAADFPPDDVAGLDGLVHRDDLPVGVVGQVRADVGDAAVVDVGVGGLAILLAVVEDFFLQIEAGAAQGADDDVGADARGFGDVAHGKRDVDVVRDVADVVVELGGAAGDALGAEVAVDLGGGGDLGLVGQAADGADSFAAVVLDGVPGVGVEGEAYGDGGEEQEGQKKESVHVSATQTDSVLLPPAVANESEKDAGPQYCGSKSMASIMKAHLSACSSRILPVGLPAPWPALVSMRMSTGSGPLWAAWRRAANLKLCAGTTRSSWSAVVTIVAG